MTARYVLLTALLGGSVALAASVATAQQAPGGLLADALLKSSGNSEKTLPPKEAARACLITAGQMTRSGYRSEAISLFERARQLDPSLKQVSRYLAVLYDEDGNDSRALAEYALAQQLTPTDADLLSDIGYFYFHRGNFRMAEQWFRAALAQSPRHPRAWGNLAMAVGMQGRYEESFEAFCHVVSPAAAHSNVGLILAKHGHRQEAIAAFRQSLALEPGLAQPQAILAVLENTPAAEQEP